MESFFSRYRNLIVLLAVLLAQVIGLAVQVRKPGPATTPALGHEQKDGRSVRLIRLWAAEMVTPFERVIHGSSQAVNGVWSDYIDLRRTRAENKQLIETVDRLRLEQAMLHEDALQGQRLQGLLNFQESYIYKTTAAQVIGTSGSSQSHVIWLDKGSDDGLGRDDAVITPDGIVGKVRDVFPHTAQVLMINDQTSGAGVVLEMTRIRGILRGNAAGQPQVVNILADQRIQPGEKVLTAGGDQIFPRGLPVGVVQRVDRDPERGSFIDVVVKSAADLQHLDEVLVVTSLEPHLSTAQLADVKTSEDLKGAEAAAEAARKKATAEMAERLPGLTDPNAPKAPDAPNAAGKNGEENKPDQGPPLPPIAPKPRQPLHPDRFSPGAADTPADGAGNGVPTEDTPDSGGQDSTQPAEKPKTPAPKPKNAEPKTTRPQGEGRVR